MKNEKQKKVIFIVIIAAIVVLIATVIGVTVFALKNNDKETNKSTDKESTSAVEKATAEKITTAGADTEESTTEEVTTEELTQETTIEGPTTEEPAEEETTTQEPTTEAPTTQEPTTEETTTEKPTTPPVVEEPMCFSVEDGVLYQYNSKKKEVVETGLSTWGYTLSPNATAIYYRTDEDGRYFIRVIGKERVEIVLEEQYFDVLNLSDTGETYILGEPKYNTSELYWCRTPIYYFNGSSIQVLTDRAPHGEMSSKPTTYYAENAPVIMFEQLKSIDSAEIEGFLIAVKDRIHYFGREGYLYVFNDSGDRLWYIETHGKYVYDETRGASDFYGNHELYEVRITSEKLEPARLVDGDVSLIDLGFDPNGFETGYYSCFGNDLVYFKNSITLVEREWDKVKPIQSADMYIDGRLIDTDVVPTEVIYRKDKMCYITDWNVENESGTLTIYSNGAVKNIASKVNSFTEDNNKIYYITAWNGESGTLIEYYNGIEKTIATEVKSVYKINGVVEYWCLNGDYKEINN